MINEEVRCTFVANILCSSFPRIFEQTIGKIIVSVPKSSAISLLVTNDNGGESY